MRLCDVDCVCLRSSRPGTISGGQLPGTTAHSHCRPLPVIEASRKASRQWPISSADSTDRREPTRQGYGWVSQVNSAQALERN